jgi:hypothetical protein
LKWFEGFARLSTVRQALGLVGGLNEGDSEILADLEGPNMDVFRDSLLQARKEVEAWNGRLLFVYLPEWARYTSYTSWGKTQRDRVLAIVRDAGIQVVDIDPAFRASGDPLSLFPFRAQGHYNERGNRLVAQTVLETLSQHHVLN